MTDRALPRPRGVKRGAVDRIDGYVARRRRAVADALAVVEHRGFVLLALADDHDAVHGNRLQDHPHGVDGGPVGAFLVAPTHPPGGGQGRGLGHPDQVQGQVAFGHFHLSVRHPGTLLSAPPARL